MIKFDQILSNVLEIFSKYNEWINGVEWIAINRDLNGRVRLILPSVLEKTEGQGRDEDKKSNGTPYSSLVQELSLKLEPHSFPVSSMVIFEDSKSLALSGSSSFQLPGYENVWVADRLMTEVDWSQIEPTTTKAPRIVFFSIKGGVGRSTALAATAWKLAQDGKRVLVLDLDLESPGVSTSLLPADRQPEYGIADWLIEDLVENGDAVFDSMRATSLLSHDGEIYIVPAHGLEPGDYISKLGRAWMSKPLAGGGRENWSSRLKRLISKLEEEIQPDVILIDSRAGIDEVASSCVTDLGANLVLLFAIEGRQTWGGYRILFEHWLMRGVAEKIREQLQIVGALLPDLEEESYFEGLQENSADLFLTLYDEVPADNVDGIFFNFEKSDASAPHFPWAIKWHRSFVGLKTLDGRLSTIDPQTVQLIFGPLIDGIGVVVGETKNDAV